MFGLFKPATHNDSHLGLLTKSGGFWRGSFSLFGHDNVELRVSGGRKAPDPDSLALARELPARFDALKPQIQTSLFEHYEPYAQAVANGDLPERSEPFPRIKKAEEVWLHVFPDHVLIAPLSGSPADGPIIEIACRVVWDEEHTVGARIQEWRLFELCGSV